MIDIIKIVDKVNPDNKCSKLKDISVGQVFKFKQYDYGSECYALRTEEGYMWLSESGFNNIGLITNEDDHSNANVITYSSTLTIEKRIGNE